VFAIQKIKTEEAPNVNKNFIRILISRRLKVKVRKSNDRIDSIDSSNGMIDNNNMPNNKPIPDGMPKVETNKPNKEKSNDYSKYIESYKWSFVCLLIVLIVATVCCYCCLSKHYKEQIEQITVLQKNDASYIRNLLSQQQYMPYNRLFIDELNTTLEKHEAKEEALLELSFAKLQSDFNFISLWAGVITIVFLVFSIYSIFRTDEMLKQAQQASTEIGDLLKQAKTNLGDMNNQTSQTIISYQQITKQEVDKLQKDIDKLRKELEEINNIISIGK